MPNTELIGLPLGQGIKVLQEKNIKVEQITYTKPTKVTKDFDDERIVRVKETGINSVSLVVALFPYFFKDANDP